MRRSKNLINFSIALLVFSVISVFLTTNTAYASVNDFVINNFEADYYLSNTDKQGELKVVENIDLTFSDNNHGILRAIPNKYKNVSNKIEITKVSSTSGAPSSYSTYKENDNLVVKIGDKDKTVTGKQNYKIEYKMQNVIGFYNDHDEFYWDINGDQWLQPFEQVTARLHLPEGVNLNNQLACYAGGYGAQGNACEIESVGNIIEAKTTKSLGASSTLTMIVGIDKGFFSPQTLSDQFRDLAPMLISAVSLPVLTFTGCFMFWRKKGRDPKGKKTIVPEYSAPADLRPAEVGALLDFKVDNKDITSTIVDLAVRGHINIIEVKKDRLIGKDKITYRLEIMNKDTTGFKSFETTMLSGLRGLAVAGMNTGGVKHTSSVTLEMDDIKNKFYTTAAIVRKESENNLVREAYLPKTPAKAKSPLIVTAVVFYVLTFMAGSRNGLMFFGCLVSALIASRFAMVMPSRTAKGVEALEKIYGLKLYLETAEKERIKMLQSPNAKYAPKTNEPVKTIQLFEKLLPYAMVLGVEKEWAKEFEGIYQDPPNWYGGNFNSFNAGLFIGSLNSSMSAIGAAAFSAPSSSGGSGFSGGGFSGGGGGGGGGGGW